MLSLVFAAALQLPVPFCWQFDAATLTNRTYLADLDEPDCARGLAYDTVSVPVLGGANRAAGCEGETFHVRMSLRPSSRQDFSVGVFASNPKLHDASLQDSLWVSAWAAGQLTGRSLSGRKLEVELPLSARGTSAGLACGLGVACALEGKRVPADFAATGHLLPNGTVGPVGEMTSKVTAAAKAGIRRVAVPSVPKTETVDGKEIDPVEWGRVQGVEVRRVKTLAEAYAWMNRDEWREPKVDEAAALAVPPQVAEALTRQTANLLSRLAAAGGPTEVAAAAATELKAGRLFSARELAMVSLARQLAETEQDSTSPEGVKETAEIEAWLSPERHGMREQLRQMSEQGAPASETAPTLNFLRCQRQLEAELSSELFARGVKAAVLPKEGELSVMLALASALDGQFGELYESEISEAVKKSVGETQQLLYRADLGLLIGNLTRSLLGHRKLTPTRTLLAWLVANRCTVLARYGGKLGIEEERQSGKITMKYDCAVYLPLYVDEARKAALLAIAADRKRGILLGPAMASFERGERLRHSMRRELESGLSAFEAYLRAYLLSVTNGPPVECY